MIHLFIYVAGNPINLTDHFGLDIWDYEIDNLTSEIVGQKLYTLGAINESARWASIGLQTALDIAVGFLPGTGLYDAFKSVDVIANGKGGFWDAINIATAALPLARGVSKLVGLGALSKARGFKFRACNCFVAGTLVDTPNGQVPIESIKVGDEVVSRHEFEDHQVASAGRITRLFERRVETVLWITLSNSEIVGTTPGHEVWTHQQGWGLARNVEIGNTFADKAGDPIEVVAIEREATPTLVYNLEVEGTRTYFANGVWVHNNSCPLKKGRQLRFEAHHVLPEYLLGSPNGRLAFLDEVLHREYHAGLLQSLTNHGISQRGMGWAKYFEQHPDKYGEAMNVFMDYTREFDNQHKTGLLHLVWEQISSQYWN